MRPAGGRVTVQRVAQSIVMTLRLSTELKAQLEQAAAAEHRSTNNFIVHLLASAMTPSVAQPPVVRIPTVGEAREELARRDNGRGTRDVSPRLKG